MEGGWSALIRERLPFRGPIRAYSEFMPPPRVGLKPLPDGEPLPEGDEWIVTEYEERLELRPALEKIGIHILGELDQVPKSLLRDNPAWPGSRPVGRDPMILSLALSRTQDDKGRVRWTLFGASHDGPARAFWRSFDRIEKFREFLDWCGAPDARVLPAAEEEVLPHFARPLLLREDESIEGVRALVTFRMFGRLPPAIQRAWFDGTLRLIPSPASLLFWGHASYRKLATELPLAMQIPLLHLFPRSEDRFEIRIPQSGWLDEVADGPEVSPEGHRMQRRVRRSHRWQRIERDIEDAAALDDAVSVALFSTAPDHLGLYGKPMARNAQVWTSDYKLLLDGPRAGREELVAAERALRGGGRFGYRFFYPPMRAGERSVFWHRPVVAKAGSVLLLDGYLTAEREGATPIEFRPRILRRDDHVAAIELFDRDPGRRRRTTTGNVRRILEWRDLLETPLPPVFAQRLLAASRETTIESWLAGLPARAALLVERLRERIGPDVPPGPALTFERTRTREFEERYWRTIASLAEGEYREKNNADAVVVNDGRTGGAAGRPVATARHLDPLGDHLHRRYDELLERHGMKGRAACVDDVFRWETDFEFPWSAGWLRNQNGHPRERNIVLVIPGRARREAVIMADHYDTAYMEDVYYPSRGGDRLRAAAAGADDNHSATAALLLAADVLLPMSRDGALARDVWLVHLTGEEFPADCLGARALVERLVRGDFAPGGVDLSGLRVCGAFVLDMVAHNNDRDRDTFQISPGEGRAAARLAWRAHRANERWNRSIAGWNESPERRGRGRGRRVENGASPPPIAEHLALAGEVRPEWDPRSALYNTDAQIFSDAGIPVVLFMENYDISRAGYHDTQDTMKNIDLDYGAALAAIAIETVADAASAEVL